jgi:hypothetical protein
MLLAETGAYQIVRPKANNHLFHALLVIGLMQKVDPN